MTDWVIWKHGVFTCALVALAIMIGMIVSAIPTGLIILGLEQMSVEGATDYWWDIMTPLALLITPYYIGSMAENLGAKNNS